jgi:glucuronate isomerase
MLSPDRLFPADPATRAIARDLYDGVKGLPIISPHGHVDPRWFAEDAAFTDPVQLFILPDHYVLRMLVSQGMSLADLGVPARDQTARASADTRTIWHRFAGAYHLFAATPSRLWLDQVFADLFGMTRRLSPTTADLYFDTISDALATPAFRPRALFDRFGIEVLATTEGALDDLAAHRAIRASGWGGRIITTYRPDAVIDPDTPGFVQNVERLGALTGQDIATWDGYLAAHADRRAFFRAQGATATDHGHPSPRTLDLPRADAAALYAQVMADKATPDEAEAFRAQMLTEMARMSCEDGMVMQLHPGSWRNHAPAVLGQYGPDRGFDIPRRADFVGGLKPLLDAVGFDPRLTLIVFTLDETTLSRELAPLAGAYPCLRLGPAWWFYDSPAAMRRFRELTTETAGFYNTVGFNDDTRALCSIPARHDVARRVDCAYLADLVAAGMLDRDEAPGIAADLTCGLARRAYRL